MEKRIILRMKQSKDIEIYIGDELRMLIPNDCRTVKADEIYKMLCFTRGDHYSVEAENEEDLDAPVLGFFEELINDIVDAINKIPESDEDEYLNDTQNQ